MKKNILISVILFAGVILLNSCGYKQLYNKDSNKFYIENVVISGERKVGYLLKDDILLYSSQQSANKLRITLDSILNKEIKNKSISGKVSRYEIGLKVDLTIENNGIDKVLKKSFSKTSSFDVASSHSKTINNEKTTIKSISSSVAGDILNFMNISYK
jgi:hypothetical protein|tara:strand:+ start:1140 stop:1613 length:474 start_codon:yes stop_codon:yes gene_type:complete